MATGRRSSQLSIIPRPVKCGAMMRRAVAEAGLDAVDGVGNEALLPVALGVARCVAEEGQLPQPRPEARNADTVEADLVALHRYALKVGRGGLVDARGSVNGALHGCRAGEGGEVLKADLGGDRAPLQACPPEPEGHTLAKLHEG